MFAKISSWLKEKFAKKPEISQTTPPKARLSVDPTIVRLKHNRFTRFFAEHPLIAVLVVLFGIFFLRWFAGTLQTLFFSLTFVQGMFLTGVVLLCCFVLYVKRRSLSERLQMERRNWPLYSAHFTASFHRGAVKGNLVMDEFLEAPPRRKWQMVRIPFFILVFVIFLSTFGHLLIPPKIMVSFPGKQSSEAPLNTTIEIIFDRGMRKESVEKSFSVQPSLEGSFSWESNRKVIFTPKTKLTRATKYTVSFRGVVLSSYFVPLLWGQKTVSFETLGNPRVVIASPRHEALEDFSEVTVVFDRAMIPLTTATNSALKAPAFTINPRVEGEGRWLGTTAYQFRPINRYRRGTTYTVSVPKGMKSQDGGVLRDGYTWQFSSEKPRYTKFTPAQDYTFASPVGSVAAWFNQSIDQESAKGKLVVYDQNKNEVPGRVVVSNTIVAFYSTNPLPREKTYTARLLKGIQGTEGPNGSSEDLEWSFSTAPAPKILSTSPRNNEKNVGSTSRIEVTFASPMDGGSFEDSVTISPAPDRKPSVYFSTYQNKLQIGTYLGRSQRYTVTISGNVRDQYGVRLGRNYTFSFETSAYRPAISIYPSGTYFAAFNQQVIPRIVAQVVNVKKVDYALYKLERSDLLELYRRRYGKSNCGNSDCYNWQNYNTSSLKKIKSWSEKFDADLNTPVHVVTKVSSSKGDLLPSGFYFLDAKIDSGAHDNIVMIVSRSTMTIKRSRDQIFTWAVDQKSTDTISGMKLELTDENGSVLTSGTTNNDGVFQKNIDLRNKNDLLLFGQKGDDIVVAAASWSQGISQYDFGLPSYYYTNQYEDYNTKQAYKQFITIDRPIYRPGQTVNFKGLVRKDNDAAYESVKPGEKVSVTISEDRGKVVYSKDLPLDSFGAYADNLKLSEDGSLGFYRISSRFQGNTYSQQFQVEEYRKPEFAVSITPNKSDYVQGEAGSVSVKASYYFGASVSDSPLTWSVQSNNAYFKWNKDRRFEFGDPDVYWYWAWGYGSPRETNQRVFAEGKGSTDGRGEYVFSLPLDIREKKTSQEMTVEAVVNDQSNQAIAGSGLFTVHKSGLYVGLKPENYTNKSGKESRVEVVTLDLKQNTVQDVPVAVSFYKRTWETIREQDPDTGQFYYTSKPIDKPVGSSSVTTDSQGRAFATFTPQEGGTYRVIGSVTDANGNQNTSGTYLWVSGYGFEAPRQNHDRIVLVSDKNEYYVGDTMSFFVATPFASSSAKTLITTERGNVLDYNIVDVSPENATVTVPAVSRDAPNVFVSTVLVKGGDAVKNPAEFKIGYAEVKVTDKSHQIAVSITTDKKRYRPRETMKTTIETKDLSGKPLSSQVSLGVVDQAVFDLGGNVSLPEIYQTFYQPRSLGVATSALLTISLDRINANINLGAKGGSGGGCFTGDTLILMKGGGYKQIKDVKKGDIVLTRESESSPKLVEAVVSGTEKKTVDSYLILNGSLRVTPIHRLFVNGMWLTASHILTGDILLSKDNAPVRVFSKEQAFKKTEVYNLEIATYKTFIAGDVYVHNQKGLNDTSRFDFPDTAYWNPSLQTGADGKLDLAIKLPDSLTTWRLSAVANTASDAFGSSDDSIVVNRDVLIRPLLPRFLSIGDEPQLGGIIVNTTDEDLHLTATIATTNITLLESATKEFTVPAGQQLKLLWPARAEDAKEGSVTLTVKQGGETRDSIVQKLPIQSYSTPEVVATSGQAKDIASEKIVLPKDVVRNMGLAEFTLSPSLGGAALTSLSYLDDYLYYCGEQTVSKFMPSIYVHELFKNAKITQSGGITLEKLDNTVTDGIQRLLNSQHADGGWGWWELSPSDPFITAYSYQALLRAKQDSFAVDDTMLEKAHLYLASNLASGKYISRDMEAYILYVLQDDGADLASYTSNLYMRRFELTLQSRAYLALAMRRIPGFGSESVNLYQELVSLSKKTATTTHWEEGRKGTYFIGSNMRTTATMLEVLISFDKKSSLIPEVVRYIITSRYGDHWGSTLETSEVLRAVTLSMLASNEGAVSEAYKLTFNKKVITAGNFSKADLLSLVIKTVPVSKMLIGKENPVVISKSGTGNLYYNLNLRYFLPFTEITPLEQGMVVLRELVDEKGKLLPKQDAIDENTEAWERLTIVAPEERRYVVIEDILPAGLESVNESLKNVATLTSKPPKVQDGKRGLYFTHKEYHDNRTTIFADYLPAGVYEVAYRVRATTPGKYHRPPANAYEMYIPDISGHSDGGWFRVRSTQ